MLDLHEPPVADESGLRAVSRTTVTDRLRPGACDATANARCSGTCRHRWRRRMRRDFDLPDSLYFVDTRLDCSGVCADSTTENVEHEVWLRLAIRV